MRVLEKEGKARLDQAKCLGKSSWEMGKSMQGMVGRSREGYRAGREAMKAWESKAKQRNGLE